ncbi:MULTISPECIES: protocatechuate 3,4-dioxygenase subunit alpha [unclassified Pseudoclavibacter]|uniref:protocatechuate 3,4-dioxygenase subunit alpha n=1 Tax=unclassified Pseudoclavibacter TaxID=2615177 RepID=UPI000CE8DD04|nr:MULTISPECIES: protocatechuate 3,4-dioxygenase subunit alpha [unclassified Pseudoclavibacter]MBF4551600.1 protocatechuate 3,4-dioxygenase subunit alpha [Pseudoclavibacter sp. VKM Ac-2888]PPG01942.1 protocatechuate 3,4-dioxygenase subunit alpha [Pseudoclavibacter sp. RFBI5]
MPEPTTTEAAPLGQTPSQTVGPFYGYALPYERGGEIAAPWRPDAIRLHGTVTDGAGETVPDAILELWGLDADGQPVAQRGSLERDGYTFTGFGRAPADRDGHYSFTTIKPGRRDVGAAPYLLVTIFARGLLHHLFTRAYFGDQPAENETDPVLAGLAPERRATLIATPDAPGSYRFDIRLQGDGETVFFDFGQEL